MITLNNYQYIVKFYKQPPSHLRKSNFFSFKLMMHDLENQPIAVENAQFVDFIDTTEVGVCVVCVWCMRARVRVCVSVCVYVCVQCTIYDTLITPL